MINLFRSLMESSLGVTPEIKERFKDDELCRRCGKCCYCATRVKDRMVLLRDLPCKYLTQDANGLAECSIYQQRFTTGFCLKTGTESIKKELYAPDCPYVQGLRNYGGKVELSPEEFEQIKPILRNIFKLFDRIDCVRKSDWDKFIHQTLGLPKE